MRPVGELCGLAEATFACSHTRHKVNCEINFTKKQLEKCNKTNNTQQVIFFAPAEIKYYE